MTRTAFTIIAIVAAAALGACNKESHTIVAGGPEETNAPDVTAESNVTLPPSISASKVYRCADNDVVYVDWLSDGTANLRVKKDAGPTHLTALEPGKPLTAEGGYSINGKADAASVRIAVPGQTEESCKA